MGYMSRLHFQIYDEPHLDSECYLEEEKDPAVLFGEFQTEARRSELQEEDLLVRERCARATQILKAKKDREAHCSIKTHNL